MNTARKNQCFRTNRCYPCLKDLTVCKRKDRETYASKSATPFVGRNWICQSVLETVLQQIGFLDFNISRSGFRCKPCVQSAEDVTEWQ